MRPMRTERTAWRPADPFTVALLILRVVVLISVIAVVPHFPSSAATRINELAHLPGTPYRDFTVEYPIGELALITAIGGWSLGVARALLAVVAFGADLATFACLAAGWGREVARRYLLIGAPLLVFIYRRSDLLAVALAAGGMLACRRGRDVRAGALLGLGVLAKLWPVVLLPALVIQRRARSLAAACATAAAGVAAWLWLGGVDGIRQVLSLRGAVGWELESTIGAVVWPVVGDYRFEQGANRTGSIPGWARVAMLVLLIAGLAAVWWRARSVPMDPAGAPALVAVAILLVLSPVLSPQYMAWLLPWAAIASLDAPRLARTAVLPVAITGAILAAWYLDLHLGRPVNQTLMIVRNLSLLVVPGLWFMGATRGGRRGTEASA
jgi:hypothetical protein